MKHEVRCIEIPCTCVEILRQKIKELEEKLRSQEKKLDDGLSCCCAGCAKHNQNLKDL